MEKKEQMHVVYRRTEGWFFGETTFTVSSLRLLALVNGSYTVKELQDQLEVTPPELITDIDFLLDLGVIEVGEETAMFPSATVDEQGTPQDFHGGQILSVAALM